MLLLAPQLHDCLGGTQAYMRRLLEILSAYGRERGSRLQCLSFGDAPRAGPAHAPLREQARFESFGGSKPGFARGALRVAWGSRPHMTVVGHLGLGPLAWMLKGLGLTRAYVLLIHGIEAWTEVPRLDRRAARGAACIVAFSRYTAREFCRRNGVPQDRVRLIPLALAEEALEPPDGRRAGPGLSVLTVARLSADDRDKGVDTLIEAAARARSGGVDLHLTVVGEGDDRPRLARIAARLGLDGHVAFAGAVADGRLCELYRECDVFAMPSRKEGLGIVFLEAMRFGKPCIGGNHGGTPEILTDGENGYLVQHGDVGQLAHRLVQLAQEPELRRALGVRGYERVAAGYLLPHMRERWFSLLDGVPDRC
jgi:glycosyltransferase involved in cell wall biosynthesis